MPGRQHETTFFFTRPLAIRAPGTFVLFLLGVGLASPSLFGVGPPRISRVPRRPVSPALRILHLSKDAGRPLQCPLPSRWCMGGVIKTGLYKVEGPLHGGKVQHHPWSYRPHSFARLQGRSELSATYITHFFFFLRSWFVTFHSQIRAAPGNQGV